MPLSILIWLPAAVGVIALLLPRAVAPRFAALGSLGALGIAIYLITDYDGATAGLQHVTDELWIAELGIHYKLGLDGLNLFLVALTTLGFAAAILASNLRQWDRPRLFYLHLLIGETAVLGAFLAQDLALFVMFFDLMLIPFYFLTGQWGDGERRVQATTKLVVYTFVGSLLMLAGAIATGVLSTGEGQQISFALSDLRERTLSEGTQDWIFLLFAAAFLVKMPAFPLHGWMPDGYRAMPIAVLAVFSGVLSKVGAYGFLRIVMPTFPDAAAEFQELLMIIALASILYGSVMAFSTTNLRLVVGYSSVAQLGFVTLGIFALNDQGAQGAVLHRVNHGLVTIPLFLIIGLLAARAGSEDLRDMGGLAFRAPVLATLFLIVALATLAMPGSSNFVGEFMILLGVFESKLVIACIAFSGVVMASVYMLRAYIRSMHNRVGANVQPREIRVADAMVLVPLVAVILFFAVYPQLALERGEKSVVSPIAPVVEVTR
jgi:NADH-quinone oxidoreductase subunit M